MLVNPVFQFQHPNQRETTMKILELENEPLSKLRGIAKGLNIPNANRLKKETLAMMIREA